MVLFAAVATTYVIGIGLQYRTELGTSAEYIAQFLLEYYMSQDLNGIMLYPSVGGAKTPLDVLNLPYPLGAYEFFDDNFALIDKTPTNGKLDPEEIEAVIIYNDETKRVIEHAYDFADLKGGIEIFIQEPNIKTLTRFTSEKTPHPKYFPNIFTLDEIEHLPINTNLTALNQIFPETIRFTPDGEFFTITINSFPPFLIAAFSDLKYQVEVEKDTWNNSDIFHLRITVQWKLKTIEQNYTVYGSVFGGD